MSILRGILLALATGLIAALGIGFFSFGRGIEEARPPSPLADADAIVVLTGGSLSRLTTAMQLLEDGHGRRLLVSGVNPRAPAADVLSLLDGAPAVLACCVDLGRSAEDTLGNASETAAWAKRNGFSRLIVVTEDYHMPRSLTELAIAMPGVTLTPYPVRTRLMTSGAWRADVPASTTLAGEYLKYIMIRAREVLLGPHRSAEAPAEPAPKPPA